MFCLVFIDVFLVYLNVNLLFLDCFIMIEKNKDIELPSLNTLVPETHWYSLCNNLSSPYNISHWHTYMHSHKHIDTVTQGLVYKHTHIHTQSTILLNNNS